MVTQNQMYFLHLLRNEGCKKWAKYPKNALKWGGFSKIQRNTPPDTQKIAKRVRNGKTRLLTTSNIIYLATICKPVALQPDIRFCLFCLVVWIYLFTFVLRKPV